MLGMNTLLLTVAMLVSVETWMTPAPRHAEGLLVYYGPDWLAEANADYRGYSLNGFRDRCGLAVMSPADVGKVVWVRLLSGEWYGPCLAVDVGARHDFYDLVYMKREVAEVTTTLRDLLKFKYGSSGWGEIYVGLCPPEGESKAEEYQPLLSYSQEPSPTFWPYPKQQWPMECPERRW